MKIFISLTKFFIKNIIHNILWINIVVQHIMNMLDYVEVYETWCLTWLWSWHWMSQTYDVDDVDVVDYEAENIKLI